MVGSASAQHADAFVGRREELAFLQAALERGERIVTLVGPPGIGKTRLALEYTRGLARSGAGLARLSPCSCDLSEAGNEQDFWVAVSSALGLRSPHGRARGAPNGAVVRALCARGGGLLVLDDVERVLDPLARAVVDWVRAVPGLRVLVTSRERLRTAGEVCLEVGPLGLPSDRDGTGGDAVALFVQRARAHTPEFVFADGDLGLVASLVSSLDGNPLAIELGAARMGVLGIVELTRRLSSGIDVLSHGSRHAGTRQATFRGAIRWSWDLLSDREREVLGRASVFRGGFQIGAAEAVLQEVDPGPSLLDTLHSLRDKSMLRVRENGAGPRFDLPFGIREFAAVRLAESGQESNARSRHATAYVALALEACLDAERFGRSDATRALVPERDNLLAAHAHFATFAEHGNIAWVLDAVLALEPVLLSQGPVERLLEVVEGLFARPDAAALDDERRARGLRARAKALQLSGELDAAERDFEAALGCAANLEDGKLLASLLVDTGMLHHQRRRLPLAREHYSRALSIHESGGRPRLRARVLGNLGAVHHDERNFEAAEREYRKALALLRRDREPRLEGNILANLGVLATEQGRFDEADDHFSRAEAELHVAEDRRLLGIVRGNRGAMAFERGDIDRARIELSRAIIDLAELGDLSSQALCLARKAAVDAVLSAGGDFSAYTAAAERLIDPEEDPLALMAVRLFGVLADLSASAPVSAEVVRRVRARMAEARAPLETGASLADLSDDIRAALRLLERQLALVEPLGALLEEAPADALLVGPDAQWFRVPNGISQSLAAHGPVRRILLALVREHASEAQKSLDLDALRDAGWPSERMSPDAATNRVHVALAELRRRGLRTLLKRTSGGYALSPALPIHFMDAPFPEAS
jgi:predicted ATPase